ncbi:hypothetical protein ACWIE7_17000 [Dietzia sp. NPDC055343]
MGRFQQLRAKAISLRGAVAVAGALVMAVGMAQATGTLAQDVEVREAKAGLATQNFFPTPLTDWVTCTTDPNGSWLPDRRARIDWAPVEGATGYQVDLVHSNTGVVTSKIVDAPGTRLPNVVAPYSTAFPVANWAYRIRVRTINGPAVSSGFTTAPQAAESWSTTTDRTQCSGSSGPSVGNEPWEDEYEWTPDGRKPFSMGPGVSFFDGLFGENSDLLGDLPEDHELTSLEEVAIEAKPTTSKTASSTPTLAPPSTPQTSEDTSSEATSSTTQSNSSTSASDTSTTRAVEKPTTLSTSLPATVPSPIGPTTNEAGPRTSVESSPSSNPATTTTVAPTWARVGGGPIAVGTSQARLEDVDGQPHLTVTRGGSEVCRAEVDGATRIQSASATLSITIAGRITPVDLETCELT